MRNLVSIVALLPLLCGCATLVTGRGPDQTLRVSTTPDGADVYVDGRHIGTTPVSTEIRRYNDHHLLIELEGYRPYERYLESQLNPWLLGNIPLLFPVGTLVGFGVDLATESHRLVRPRSLDINLVPQELERPPPP